MDLPEIELGLKVTQALRQARPLQRTALLNALVLLSTLLRTRGIRVALPLCAVVQRGQGILDRTDLAVYCHHLLLQLLVPAPLT